MARSVIATVFFLVITIALSLLSIPISILDRSGRLYLWFTRVWGKIFLMLYGIKISVSGLENINKKEHYVYVSNHSSYTDIPILFAAIPYDLRLILRSTLTKIPIWGWALLLSPMIIINRSNAAKAKKTLTQAAAIIRGGASVLLFPEGTRTSTGQLQAFKRGAFHMAYESGANVIPVAIKGSFDILPRTGKLPRTNLSGSVLVGEPLEIQMSIAGEREREMDLMRRAEAAVQALLKVNL
jgi:1-acyl-sn-glycerol-3-phosphate acyltransferase